MSNDCVPYIDNEVDAYWLEAVCWDCCNITLLVRWGYTTENYNYQVMLRRIHTAVKERHRYYLNHDEMGLFLICMNLFRNQNQNWINMSKRNAEHFQSLYDRLFDYWSTKESFITGKPVECLKLDISPSRSYNSFRRIDECCITGKLLDENE